MAGYHAFKKNHKTPATKAKWPTGQYRAEPKVKLSYRCPRCSKGHHVNDCPRRG